MIRLKAITIFSNGLAKFQADIARWLIHPVDPDKKLSSCATIVTRISTHSRAEDFWVHALDFALLFMSQSQRADKSWLPGITEPGCRFMLITKAPAFIVFTFKRNGGQVLCAPSPFLVLPAFHVDLIAST